MCISHVFFPKWPPWEWLGYDISVFSLLHFGKISRSAALTCSSALQPVFLPVLSFTPCGTTVAYVIDGATVETVSTYKYLGLQLDWSSNSDAMYKKTKQCLSPRTATIGFKKYKISRVVKKNDWVYMHFSTLSFDPVLVTFGIQCLNAQSCACGTLFIRSYS